VSDQSFQLLGNCVTELFFEVVSEHLDETIERERVFAFYTSVNHGSDHLHSIGARAALGTLFIGADPEEAVQNACAIDSYCGGPITVERLPN